MRWWLTKSARQLAEKRPKDEENTTGNGNVTGGDRDHGEGKPLGSQNLSLSERELWGWSASLEEACRCKKMIQKVVITFRTGIQNAITRSKCGGTSAGGGSWAIGAWEVVTMVLVRLPEAGWRLTSGGPKWQRH